MKNSILFGGMLMTLLAATAGTSAVGGATPNAARASGKNVPRESRHLSPPARYTRRQVRRVTRLRERAGLYEPLIALASIRHGVDPRLLWTIAYLETRFRTHLVSPKGARGMMQFMPATAASYRLHDPHYAPAAVDAAARLVRDLERRFRGNVAQMLAAYNAGETAVEAFRDGRRVELSNKIINAGGVRTAGGIPPYGETRRYVARGLMVFRAVTNAGVFSPRLVARTGHRDETPVIPATPELIALMREIHPSQFVPRVPSPAEQAVGHLQLKSPTRSFFYASSPGPGVRVTKSINASPEAQNKLPSADSTAQSSSEIVSPPPPRVSPAQPSHAAFVDPLSGESSIVINASVPASSPSKPAPRTSHPRPSMSIYFR